MPAPIDLSGQRFGHLIAKTVTRLRGVRAWTLQCDCGKETAAEANALRCGHVRSCGCRDGGHPKPELTQARLFEVLNYDAETGVFLWKAGVRYVTPGTVAGCLVQGYVIITIDGTSYQAHKLAWLYVTGAWPPQELDHRDWVRHNNRISNLRVAGKSSNGMNRGRPSNNKSGFKGVYWATRQKRWLAKISVQGNHIYLGQFKNPVDAAHAYDAAAKIHFGEFAWFNFGGTKNESGDARRL